MTYPAMEYNSGRGQHTDLGCTWRSPSWSHLFIITCNFNYIKQQQQLQLLLLLLLLLQQQQLLLLPQLNNNNNILRRTSYLSTDSPADQRLLHHGYKQMNISRPWHSCGG
jgi:hypothetical protein